MRKWLVRSAVLLLTLGLATPAQAQGKFWLQVVGDNNEAVVNGRCIVLTAGANTLPTVYTTASLATTASNPLTMDSASGVCEWFGATTPAAYDAIVVVDSGAYKGATVRVDNVTRTGQHTVRVNRASPYKRLYVPFPSTAAATATTDTRTLPAGAIVDSTILWTTTAVAGSSIAVGHGANGAEANICNGNLLASGQTLQESNTSTVGLSFCNATSVGSPRNRYQAAASGAIRIHNQNHATGGFAVITYLDGVNEP